MAEIEYVPKKRGRPKKNFEVVEGKTLHKMSDIEPTTLFVTAEDKLKLIADFKDYHQVDGLSLQESFAAVEKLYDVSHAQARAILEEVF